jgi:hypothetical protein
MATARLDSAPTGNGNYSGSDRVRLGSLNQLKSHVVVSLDRPPGLRHPGCRFVLAESTASTLRLVTRTRAPGLAGGRSPEDGPGHHTRRGVRLQPAVCEPRRGPDRVGSAEIVVAAGVELMSRHPLGSNVEGGLGERYEVISHGEAAERIADR